MEKKGIFITLEGGEGCGKTTHARILARHLEKKGYKVVLTREPGATPLGKLIRKILLSSRSELVPLAELFLFASDRAQHVEKVILPALRRGFAVVSDRFIDSTFAYQIGGRGLPEDVVRYLNFVSSGALSPDITFLLDISPPKGMRRAAERSGTRDRFEKEKMKFHDRVRAQYLLIAKNSPERVKVIDSDDDLKAVSAEILRMMDGFLRKRG